MSYANNKRTDQLALSRSLTRIFSASRYIITKTCLYNFYPLKPHFYIVKLGFTVVYTIFLISAEKNRLWVLVRTALYFEQKYEKYQNFYLKLFTSLVVKFSVYLNRNVFVMSTVCNRSTNALSKVFDLGICYEYLQ